ncbi:MAG TPA: hypothetical protein VFD01_17045 [Candidatus Dormibacteraeota bacterium]|nr:hypothetical protein [Candidatus Dormibacteraeota bacterium]
MAEDALTRARRLNDEREARADQRAIGAHFRGVKAARTEEDQAYRAGQSDARRAAPRAARSPGRAAARARRNWVGPGVARATRPVKAAGVSAVHLVVIALGLVLLYLFLVHGSAVASVAQGALRLVTGIVSPTTPAVPA